MSVCHSPETLALCAHNRPLKFGCSECYFATYPEVKEETITIKKALWDEMLEYKNKIDALIHEVFST